MNRPCRVQEQTSLNVESVMLLQKVLRILKVHKSAWSHCNNCTWAKEDVGTRVPWLKGLYDKITRVQNFKKYTSTIVQEGKCTKDKYKKEENRTRIQENNI